MLEVVTFEAPQIADQELNGVAKSARSSEKIY